MPRFYGAFWRSTANCLAFEEANKLLKKRLGKLLTITCINNVALLIIWSIL